MDEDIVIPQKINDFEKRHLCWKCAKHFACNHDINVLSKDVFRRKTSLWERKDETRKIKYKRADLTTMWLESESRIEGVSQSLQSPIPRKCCLLWTVCMCTLRSRKQRGDHLHHYAIRAFVWYIIMIKHICIICIGSRSDISRLEM